MELASIVVSSVDKYSDCWPAFFHGLKKYWPDCPFPTFLISNHKSYADPRVTVLRLGEDRGWAANLLAVLERIDMPYVIYFQEDYWIRERVDSARIQEYIALMEEHDGAYLRLLAVPPPDGEFPADSRLGLLSPQSGYRTSLQAAIWRRETLRELLRADESAWEFEVKGTERSRHQCKPFLSIRPAGPDDYAYGIRYLCSAINRGHWVRAAKDYARQEGIEVVFGNLPHERWWHDLCRGTRLERLAYRASTAALSSRGAVAGALGRIAHRKSPVR